MIDLAAIPLWFTGSNNLNGPPLEILGTSGAALTPAALTGLRRSSGILRSTTVSG